MTPLYAILDNPKVQGLIPSGLLAVALGSLGFALFAQYVQGLEPCPLCIYQRVPFVVIGLLGVLGLVKRDPGLRWIVVILSAFAFAIGAVIAFYHVGVEQHWWASAVCGGSLADNAATTRDLLAGLNAPPEKSCDEADWTFLGLSMATYNVAFSGGLAGLCVLAARRIQLSGH